MIRFFKGIRQRAALAGVTAAALLSIPALSGAETPLDRIPDVPAERSIWIVEYENDIFSGADRYYTSGLRLSRVGQMRNPPSWFARLAQRFPGIDEGDTLPYRLSINHNLYTPNDIENPVLPPDDRPYAAWFNVQFATGKLTDRGADRFHVGLGVVGPWAFGEEVQKGIHSLIGSPPPRGWDTQIRNEPTLQLGYSRFRRVLSLASEGGAGFDATWTGGATAGNAHTHLSAGGFLRLGHNLPRDHGPPRITPAVSGASYFLPLAEPAWYLYIGVEGRRVFRDLFLEGNTFGGVNGVSRERLVGETFAGFVYTQGPFRFAYTHVWRSREFLTQIGTTSYGSLSFSVWW